MESGSSAEALRLPPPVRTGRDVLFRILLAGFRIPCHRSPVPVRLAFPLRGPFGLNDEPWSPTGTGSVRSPPDRGIPLRSVRPEHGCPIERASFGGCTPGVRSLPHLHTWVTGVDTHTYQVVQIGGPSPCLPTTPGRIPAATSFRGPVSVVLKFVCCGFAELYVTGLLRAVQVSLSCDSLGWTVASEPFTTGRSTFPGASVSLVTHSLACLAELDST